MPDDHPDAPADRHRAARAVVPPIPIRVWPARIWPPTIGIIGTPIWQRAAGAQTSEPVPGLLTELLVTQSGDILGRVEFPLVVDYFPRVEVMLLPISDMWELRTDSDRMRALQLVREFGTR
ncbi:hypothetical protein [Nocardia sp. NPDC060249]|uniref:hypothetical protein n=1 Tax=Nocardia sp. NPDC060249 TaxID=3347082 RepID=UPI00365BBBBE